jgi:hypothetical protein
MHPEDGCEFVPRSGSINVSEAGERNRWAHNFSVSEAVLMKAVHIVGTSITELRKLFCPEDHDPARR